VVFETGDEYKLASVLDDNELESEFTAVAVAVAAIDFVDVLTAFIHVVALVAAKINVGVSDEVVNALNDVAILLYLVLYS